MARSAFLIPVCPLLLIFLVASSARSPAIAQMPVPTAKEREIAARIVNPYETVAKVGDQLLLSGDVLPTVNKTLNQMLAEYQGQIPEEALQQQRAVLFPGLFRQLLQRKIEIQLIYIDFLRTVPQDKVKEVLKNITKQVDEQFNNHELESTMKQMNVDSLRDLENKLESLGSSIPKLKKEFRQQMIARTMVSKNVERNPEVTHHQLLTYYHEHSDDYDLPAKARWEQLTVLFERFPDKASAERAIVDMGNQVLHGAPLDVVAKRLSQGTNAATGGLHDWTTKGALVSHVLDQAIFSLPLNRLSQVLEDEQGFHIIRVLERREAGRIPFTEAQEKIRETLQSESRSGKVREYIERLRKTTYVWTIFDDLESDTEAATPADRVVSQPPRNGPYAYSRQ